MNTQRSKLGVLVTVCALAISFCTPIYGDVGSPEHGSREGYSGEHSSGGSTGSAGGRGAGSGSSHHESCRDALRESRSSDDRGRGAGTGGSRDADKLRESAKETRAYAERKEKEAKEHDDKAKALNDRIQGSGMQAAQDSLERVAVENARNAAKGVGQSLTGQKGKAAGTAGKMAKDLGTAIERRDNVAADIADPGLTAERDKEQAAADNARKEAKAARNLAEHLDRGARAKSGSNGRDHTASSRATNPEREGGHGIK